MKTPSVDDLEFGTSQIGKIGADLSTATPDHQTKLISSRSTQAMKFTGPAGCLLIS
jgi:hypothetical protein